VTFSNSYKVQLNKGKNKIDLKFEDWNIDMDGKINVALLDSGQPHLKHSFIKQNTLSTNYTNEH